MSLWELAAAVEGWNMAQGGEEARPELTGKDYDDMIERHADWIATVH